MFGGLGIPELLIILWLIPLSLGAMAFWVWMLVECATKEPNTGNQKVVWVLIILFAHFIGAAIYFFARRPKRIAEVGS